MQYIAANIGNGIDAKKAPNLPAKKASQSCIHTHIFFLKNKIKATR